MELVAGSARDLKKKRSSSDISQSETMVYMLDGGFLKDLLNQYPRYRSFIITRSMVRRSYFKKIFEQNKQIVLMQKKQQEHSLMNNIAGIQDGIFDSNQDDRDSRT